jgi:NAD(P)-dependent dehydrogenase (short-subunit alcohol dehydrogenase family)
MIAITGHANGIGKALFERYPGSLGFDLANGYNIDGDIYRILEESKHCNVFINNAYHYNRQTDLLQAWYQQHRNDKFIIINISSIAADPNLEIGGDLSFLAEYAEYKKNLNKLSFDINFSKSCCKSVIIMPAIVDTEFSIPLNSADQQAKEKFQQSVGTDHLIETSAVVDAVDIAIQSFTEKSFISAITITNQ